jgi:hypothetical protein
MPDDPQAAGPLVGAALGRSLAEEDPEIFATIRRETEKQAH